MFGCRGPGWETIFSLAATARAARLELFVKGCAGLLSESSPDPILFVLQMVPGPAMNPAEMQSLTEMIERIERPQKALLMSADTLQRAGFRVREDGSTSAAVEDIYGILLGREANCHNLSQDEYQEKERFFRLFDQIVVRVRGDALLHYQRQNKQTTLHYAVSGKRQAWFHHGRDIIGLDSLVTVGIVKAWLENRDAGATNGEEWVLDSILPESLAWTSNVVTRGYLGAESRADFYNNLIPDFTGIWKWCKQERTSLSALEDGPALVGKLTVGSRAEQRAQWSLFRETFEETNKRVDPAIRKAIDWTQVAIGIARRGPEAARFDGEILARPYRVFQLGKILSMDREEIDGLISMQRLILTHLQEQKPKHPLCVGVFGPPGSGKSFGVKQIAESLAAWQQPVTPKPLEFNVAQFTSLADLAEAFHQVRDLTLETGMIPVAIFDEFDAAFEGRAFGWLKYFLMPMQDGKFMDGAQVHHTGNAIFIFAGGINHSFGEFSSRQRDRAFCDAKGPDFISRLRGIHNIPQLNRPVSAGPTDFPDWMVRRAILLHNYLRDHAVRIEDDRLLRALLSVPGLHHGARSLEALVEMCIRVRGAVVGRANLPPRDQLDLHVDAQEFWRIVRGEKAG